MLLSLGACCDQVAVRTASAQPRRPSSHTCATSPLPDAAHEIRHLGTDMAHGDLAEPVSKSDATEILTLMDEVLAEVFQSPARVARLQAARAAKMAKP